MKGRPLYYLNLPFRLAIYEYFLPFRLANAEWLYNLLSLNIVVILGIKCTPCSLFLGRSRTFVSILQWGQYQDLWNKLYDVFLRDASVSIQSRCCYLKFLDEGVLPISLHMTNTVFIDRAIIVQVQISARTVEFNFELFVKDIDICSRSTAMRYIWDIFTQ